MKKSLIPLLIVSLASTVLAQNNSPTALRDPEAYRADQALRARAAALEASMATAQTDIDAVEAVAAAAVPKASLAQLDTNVVADATLHVPAFVGQILVGSVSNLVFIAEGLTTNSWINVSATE